MTRKLHRRYSLALCAAAAGAAGAVTLCAAGPAAAADLAPSAPLVQAQAAATDISQQLNAPVTDHVGVLSGSDVANIEEAIQQLQSEEQLTLRVVYLPDFGGQDAEQWTQQAVQASGGGNTGVLAIAPEIGQYGIYGGNAWQDSDLDALNEGVLSALQQEDWGGAPVEGIDAVLSQGELSGASAAWLGAGGLAVVGAGGGIWWYSRRQTKKRHEDSMATSRELSPSDTRQIASLPIETLRERSEEVIVTTDESVRSAQEDMRVAESEFGPDRTRPFRKALNNATSALQRAYQIRAKLNDSIPETEQQQRAMYTDIISSCGEAEQALDEQAEKFAELRNLLIHAASKLDELTQRTVDLRARLEPAKQTLENLRASYSAEVLTSIDDNDEMIAVALDEAEAALARGRELEHQPAGQQGGLIEAIRESERATNLADSLLEGIEHGEQNIATAKNQLPDLIEEVEGEIAEAGQLKQRGSSQGAKVDWEKLDKVVDQARAELEKARGLADTDPLTAHSDLMHVDSLLDDELDAARETTQNQERQLALFDQQLATAHSQLTGAEDLIASRGRLIRSQARTHLAEGQRLAAQAQHLRLRDTRQATEHARAASVAAQRAMKSAKDDIDQYRRRQNAQSSGQMITGMVIGSLLSGGGRGGFGGGFGGGGGGFGGGGGGGFRGGSF